MALLNRRHPAKQPRNIRKTLLLSSLGKIRIHLRPLKMLSLSSIFQVLRRGAYPVVQQLKPYLCVLLLIYRRNAKNLRNLIVSVLLCFVGIVAVLVPRLRFPRKCRPQVFLGAGTPQLLHHVFHKKTSCRK